MLTGDELLRGFVQDANSQHIARDLRNAGIDLTSMRTVGDGFDELQLALAAAAAEVGNDGLVITTGGLGPTHDDRTTEAIAIACARPLEFRPDALSSVEERLRMMGRLLTAADRVIFDAGNRKQATFPDDALVLKPAGTAPGYVVRALTGSGDAAVGGGVIGTTFVVLPGPPGEMRYAWKQALASAPLLRLIALAPPQHERLVRIWAVPESAAAVALEEIGHVDSANVTVTLCARDGELELSVRGDDPAGIDDLVEKVCLNFEDQVFALDDERTAVQMVADSLKAAGQTVATAESCTGGLLAKQFTDFAGSSAWMLGGAVVYSNELKTGFADVPAAMIELHGAVSAEVAAALASGIRARVGSDFGVGITGIAGPGGGSDEKPVGTVYVGLASPAGVDVQHLQLPGNRRSVRVRTCIFAVHLLRQQLAPASGQRSAASIPGL